MADTEGQELVQHGEGTEASTESRLTISKIVCENFKSYAGVKELGPFHKNFTSIVGPNGSGKSNVIDSMLFVFGYRARRIRSKKISVLIHNSEHHQNVQSCTVSVHFQRIIDLPDNDFKVVPNSQFVVSRTAYKDNSSHYQLNGRKVPFKEVAALLRGCGIDLDHNRFLILQGEVEQIALMKPKALSEHDDGMLEFLEDIIGTTSYKEPIEELSKKVEELGEARGEKLNRVKAAEKDKNALEGAKNEAEHFLALKRDKAKKQHALYTKYIQEHQEADVEAKRLKEEVQTKVDTLQATLRGHTESKKEKLKVQKKVYKVYERLGAEEEQYKLKMKDCENRDYSARQDLKNANANSKKLTKSLEKEQEKLAELEAAPDKLAKEIQGLEKKLVMLEARKVDESQKLAEVMEGLKTATQGLQEEKEVFELKLVDLNKAANEAKSKFEVSQAELDLYKEKFSSGERQLKEAEQKLKDIRKEVAEKKSQAAKLEKSLPSKRKALEKSESELMVLEDAFEKLSQQCKDGRGQVEESRSAIDLCKRRGQVLSSLIEQRDAGRIPGIYGRLGDLGAIDEKYDIAISTACGALDNIVVDTMDTAIKCVEFLRQNNVGVATFIGLDKIEHLRSKLDKISTPENVPRLFDLVRPKDPRYLTAFYYALRNTLVGKDLEQATRIGLQGKTRYRVVTLSGQVVDIAGTMSGGGNRPMKGRMSSKLHSDVTPQQLQQMEQQLQRDEQALQDCAGKKATAEDQIKQLRTEIRDMEKSCKQLLRDVEVMSVQDSALSERMKDLQLQAQQEVMDPVHLAKLEKQVGGFEKEHKKTAEAAGKVQKEVDRLHNAIMQVGGSRMQSQQAQLDAVKADITKTNAAMAKAKVGIKTAERNTGKCQKKISSLEEELKVLKARKEELKGMFTSLEDEAREILAEQEKIKSEVAEHEGTLQQLKAEIEGLEAEEASVQAGMVDFKHELEQHSIKLKDCQQKIKYYQNELKKLDVGKEGAPAPTEEELQAMDKETLRSEIATLEERLEGMTPNMAAIEEYRRKEELHQARLEELDSVTGERDEARRSYEGLRKERLDKFMGGFSVITNKLKEMYQMITQGGDAELELVDSLDPFSEGIVFSVRPPKKSWKNISNLSGGEKTLSSLALVFALHHYKPSPLYVMDEIDAALDFKNVSIVAHYIKERTKDAQFIIISLRNNMFELADRLVGIYKTDNTTKSVTVDPFKITQHSSRPVTASME